MAGCLNHNVLPIHCTCALPPVNTYMYCSYVHSYMVVAVLRRHTYAVGKVTHLLKLLADSYPIEPHKMVHPHMLALHHGPGYLHNTACGIPSQPEIKLKKTQPFLTIGNIFSCLPVSCQGLQRTNVLLSIQYLI